jgi:hypothetical protein
LNEKGTAAAMPFQKLSCYLSIRLSMARHTCLALFFSGRFHLRMDAALVWFLDQPPKSSNVYFPCISLSPYALILKPSVPVFRFPGHRHLRSE